MSPLEGVVIDRGVKLMVRLSTGARVRIPRQKDLRLGDTCFILFDFTRLVVRDVWSEEEYYNLEDVFGPESMDETPPDAEEPHRWAEMSNPVPGVSL